MSSHNTSSAVTINGRHVELSQSPLLGRQVLGTAGFNPADDHVLIEVVRPGSRTIGLDEAIVVHGASLELHAFRSDRVFNFTIDGRGYVWGSPVIAEERLRNLSGIAEDHILVLEHSGQPGLELDEGAEINLGQGGTEHLRSIKGQVTVCFNGPDREIPRKTYTTEELIEVLGVERGYLLNMMGHDKQLQTLKPGQHVAVRKGHKFVSQAPCGGSS